MKRKWIKRCLYVFLTLVISAGIYLIYIYLIQVKMSPGMINEAETALARGITIGDSQDDFVSLEINPNNPKENNPSQYRIPYGDLKTIEMGADENWLYYKATFQGTFPVWPESFNGDTLNAVKVNFEFSNAQGEAQILMVMGTGWEPVVQIPATSSYYFWGPTGIEWPEEQRYLHKDSDNKINGGAGTDYLMGALPMEKLGLKPGQTIYVFIWSETRSMKYTHAAFDPLFDGKERFEWIIGGDTYQIIPP